jgi:hypothetical protein
MWWAETTGPLKMYRKLYVPNFDRSLIVIICKVSDLVSPPREYVGGWWNPPPLLVRSIPFWYIFVLVIQGCLSFPFAPLWCLTMSLSTPLPLFSNLRLGPLVKFCGKMNSSILHFHVLCSPKVRYKANLCLLVLRRL